MKSKKKNQNKAKPLKVGDMHDKWWKREHVSHLETKERFPLITRKKSPFSHSHQKMSAITVPNTTLLKNKVQT